MCTFDHVGIYVPTDQMYTWNRSYLNTNMIKCTHGTVYLCNFCSMCTFDHVGIYIASVPCVHMEQKLHKYQHDQMYLCNFCSMCTFDQHDQMYTFNRSYINTDCSMCTFDHVGIYVPSVPCVHLIMLVFMYLLFHVYI